MKYRDSKTILCLTDFVIHDKHEQIFLRRSSMTDTTKEQPMKKSLAELQAELLDLRKQLEAFNACMLSGRMGLWDWNVDTDEVTHHLNDFQLLGYDESIQDLSDQGWLAHIYPEDLRTNFAEVQNTKDRSREEFDFNFRVRSKRKDTRWISSRGRVVEWDKNSKPARIVGSHLDVTQQKFFETQLKNTKVHLDALLEAFDGGAYIASMDYRIENLNKQLADKIGYNAVGAICHETLYGYGHPCPWCTMNEVMRGKTVCSEYENPMNGRWFYCINTPSYGLDDKTSQQTTFIDITHIKNRQGVKQDVHGDDNLLLKLSDTGKPLENFHGIVGRSQAMQRVYKLMEKAGQSSASVVIYGESGTGKELAARAIHNCTANVQDNFVAINCGAIPDNLIESEFFGYAKGAFTGAGADKQGYLEAADGGTLFMDEIGEIDLNLQVKLLRVVEGHGFRPVGGQTVKNPMIRFITATNRDLFLLVKEGKMRQDFFFRINVFPIELPPLRERKEDIPLLVDHFLTIFHAPDRLRPFPDAYMNRLLNHDWPGNIRELQNLIHRYIAFGELNLKNTILTMEPSPSILLPTPSMAKGKKLKDMMQEFEQNLLQKTLDDNRWQKVKVARLLGINRKTLFEKIKRYGLE